MAGKIEQLYHSWYRKAFPEVPELMEYYLPLGRLPKVKPPEGKYARAVVKLKDYRRFRIGTETYEPDRLGVIRSDNPKTLLKNGTLRAQLMGNKKPALRYFSQAMKFWDGGGFRGQHTKEGLYHTRCLAYALIAERALKTGMPGEIHKQVETRLWSCQDGDGGIWTGYNADGSFSAHAKKTNEIAPLALLACDDEIWL